MYPYLNDNGIVYFWENSISTSKSADGRYFLEFIEQLVGKILAANARLKMEKLWYTKDVSGRNGLWWMNVVSRGCGVMVLGGIE